MIPPFTPPPVSPLITVAGTLVVLVGFLVLGMIATVLRMHVRSLQVTGSGGHRLLLWHVLLVAASQACFVIPIILGVLEILGALDSPRPLRFGLYLAGMFLTVAALCAVARRIRQRDSNTRATEGPA